MTYASAAAFVPAFASVSIAATTSATVVTSALPTGSYTALLITNEGTTTAMVNLGTDNTVTASTAVGVPILGATKMIIRLPLTSKDAPTPLYTTAAASMVSGTATIRLSSGDGGV